MKGKTGLRKNRGKQPHPYWKYQEEGKGRGRWWHPKTLLKSGLAAAGVSFLSGFAGMLLGRWAADWVYYNVDLVDIVRSLAFWDDRR